MADLSTVPITDPLLIDIAAATRLCSFADESLENAVRKARRAGLPWRAIAGALGVKYQSAQERFGKLEGMA